MEERTDRIEGKKEKRKKNIRKVKGKKKNA